MISDSGGCDGENGMDEKALTPLRETNLNLHQRANLSTHQRELKMNNSTSKSSGSHIASVSCEKPSYPRGGRLDEELR